MKGDKTALVPKLRFPEFREGTEWEVKPLSALARRQSKRNANQEITRVLTNSAEHGVVDQRDYFEKDIATQGNLDSYFIVELGDYVYNPRISNTAPVGPIGKNKVGTGVMSPLYTVFRFVSNENSFYEQYFRSSYWHKYLQQISNSGARHDRMAISTDAFIGMPLPAPDPAEQQKIAECLTSADELIAAQAEKVEALKAHKRGLMQQLFPRPERTENGVKIPAKTQPRRRFPEFERAGEWQKAKLSAVCQLQAGKFVKASEIKEHSAVGLFPCYGGNGLRGYTKSFTHSGRYPLVGRQGALCGNVKFAVGRFHATEHAVVANPTIGVSVDWLLYLLDHLNLNQFATGQAQPGLSVDVLNNVITSIPQDQAEQQRIADCLISHDDLIADGTRKLDAIKTYKKGLMQQLFPTVKEYEP